MDPGISIFGADADPQQFAVAGQNREEEDEQEDQKRREAELNNMVQEEFNDLVDGDDSSILSTSGSEDDDDDDEGDVNAVDRSLSSHHSNSSSHGGHSSNSPVSPPRNNGCNGISPNHPFRGCLQNGINSHQTGQYPDYGRAAGGFVPNDHDSYSPDYRRRNFEYVTSNKTGDRDGFGDISSIRRNQYRPTNGVNLADVAHNGTGIEFEENIFRHADMYSQEQLMALYSARNKEVQSLSNALQNLQLEKTAEMEKLKKNMMLLEAEKQGAFLSHKEAQNLMVQYKSDLQTLKEENDNLRISNLELEKKKEELMKELELVKASGADLLQKVTFLEKNGNGLRSEKHMDSFLKTIKQNHAKELEDLQAELNSVTEKLDRKDCECFTLERKLRDTERSRETLILEKTETINKLLNQLEEAQHKLQAQTSSEGGQELIKLRLELQKSLEDRKVLQEKLTATTRKLDSVEKDLQQYEFVNRMGLLSNEESGCETDSVIQMALSSGYDDRQSGGRRDSTRQSNQYNKDDLTSKLKDELHRALQSQRSKREEIRRLQEEVSIRDRKIKTMKEQEKVYFAEAENFKKTLASVLERLKQQDSDSFALQKQTEDLKASREEVQKLEKERDNLTRQLQGIQAQVEKTQLANADLVKEMANLQLELDQAKLKQVDQASAQFLAFHDESVAHLRHESARQQEALVIDYRVRMEQAQKECEEVKKLYVEVCSSRREMLTRLREEESRNKQITNDVRDLKEALSSLETLHTQERDLSKRFKADLDSEKEKTAKLLKQIKELEESLKEKVSDLGREKWQEIHEMEKEKREAIIRAESLEKRLSILEEENRRLQEKIVEESTRSQKEAIQQTEIERVSRELKLSRERVLQLEKRLTSDFQAKMLAMAKERDFLQTQLKEKEKLLEEYLQSLTKIQPLTQEASTNTSEISFIESCNSDGVTLSSQQIADLKETLRKTESDHRAALEMLHRQFSEKIAFVEKHKYADFQKELAALDTQHKAALSAAEERVKEETVHYFVEEISKIQEKHRIELGNLAKKLVDTEAVFSRQASALKSALEQKSIELEKLRNNAHEIDARQPNAETSNCTEEHGDCEKVLAERHKLTEFFDHWSMEIKELQERKNEIEKKCEDLQAKYKNAKKAAIHYKKLSLEREKFLMDEKQRLKTLYRDALDKLEIKIADMLCGREREVADHIQRIESQFQDKVREVTQKLNEKGVK